MTACDLLGDGRALADILALAGPDMAGRMLRQMQTDLQGVAGALGPALDGADWTTIRAQSHVLIALAGTIGAARLHALAIDLNIAAHDRDAARIAALGSPVMADLAALSALITAREAAA